MTQPINIKNNRRINNISCSMIIDNHSPVNNSFMCTPPEETVLGLSKIQTRQRTTWIDDKYVEYCFSCKTAFTFYIRTHHCRKCGNVFCYKCSENRMIIPEYIDKISTEPSTISKNISMS